jgi:hypothetical protein
MARPLSSPATRKVQLEEEVLRQNTKSTEELGGIKKAGHSPP